MKETNENRCILKLNNKALMKNDVDYQYLVLESL